MSDINTYANEAAITVLSNPINGDLVLNQDNNSLYLCTDAELAGLARWKKFANDAEAEAFIQTAFYATEAEILERSGDPDRTIAYAADTQNLYVYSGLVWYIYKNDDIIENNDFNAA